MKSQMNAKYYTLVKMMKQTISKVNLNNYIIFSHCSCIGKS